MAGVALRLPERFQMIIEHEKVVIAVFRDDVRRASLAAEITENKIKIA